jgi:hypothetical protein
LSQVNWHMSPDIRIEPTVESSRTFQPRKGRGFSIDEITQTELTVKAARSLGLIVDLRRKTSHEENVEALKQYLKDVGKRVVRKPVEQAAPAEADSVIAELMTIRAVKKADALKLSKAGVKSLSDLAYCEIGKVSKKTGIEEDRLAVMVKAALKKV